MIPILFDPFATEYNNNGLGALVDAGYCTVTEERNGAFELKMQYPVNGHHYSYLTVDCQILAKPNETSNPQAFRIYHISKPMNGVVTVSAEHISYQLSSVIVSPFSANNVVDALDKIKKNSLSDNPFTFWTDKETEADMSQTLPMSARSLLGGVAGSVLDTYTGEYEFDNYTVKLHQNRGNDNGVVIAYAKNLTGVQCNERIDGIVTGALAVWIKKDENDNVISEVYGDLQSIDTQLSYHRNVVVDCSADFEEEPTKDKLNEAAQKYIERHKNVPYFSVSVEFVNLGDTEEYKQYKLLERVSLCDIVTIRHPLYGIDVTAKVVKTVFDSIKEKYDKIQVGEVSANLSQTIVTQEKEIAQKVTHSALEKAIIRATNAITGNSGGYVVLHPAEHPQEILIMDEPTIEEAVKVWRWNNSGLGYSDKGYDGPYETAITADGEIVASFITTGKLDAGLVEVINLNADNITTGTMSADFISGGTIDATDVTLINLDASNITTGTLNADLIEGLEISADDITTGTFSADMIKGGTLDASDVTITNLTVSAAQITSGTIDVARIPDLSADKITSGKINADLIEGLEISADDITTGTFSADMIKSGMLQSDDGDTYFDLENGEIKTVSEISQNKYNAGIILKSGYIDIQGQKVSGSMVTGELTSIGGMGKVNHVFDGVERQNLTFWYESTAKYGGIIFGEKRYNTITAFAEFYKSGLWFEVERCKFNCDTNFSVFAEDNVYLQSPKIILAGSAEIAPAASFTSNHKIYVKPSKVGESVAITTVSPANALDAVSEIGLSDYGSTQLIADENVPSYIKDFDGNVNLFSYCGLLALAARQLGSDVADLKSYEQTNDKNLRGLAARVEALELKVGL